MSLTSAQLEVLKADMVADQAINSLPHNSDNAFAIASIYNQPASPSFYIWRTSVSIDEIMLNGFDWTRVDNLTVGKARIWEWMTALGSINPSQANVRAGVNACFSASGDAANRAAVYAHCQREASRAEKLFSTGTGTTTTDLGVGPAITSLLTTVDYSDVYAAWQLP